ncbi:hypothetical protein HZF02_32805 (plasmid) [Pseudomonas yamanorum]|nr:hypothetical protein HZF02_32805 [Pseudomonas yamanorum]
MKHSRHEENLAYLAKTGRLSKTKKANQHDGYTDFREKKGRPAGVSLKPAEVAPLVAAALASGGPIKPGEAFEHFLSVVCDSSRFYAYHFIVAAPRGAGGCRAILLSGRTLNGPCKDRAATLAYAARLVEYAGVLGSPRVMIDETSHCCFLAQALSLNLPNSLVWADARVQWPPTDETLQTQYLDNYALGFDRYKQALANKTVKLPEMELLVDQATAMAPRIDAEGRMTLNSPGDKMERELNALCLLYLDEERAHLAQDEGARLAG